KLAELQRNLVLSHSVGTGPDLASDTVRLILAIKAVSLARGHSGVRPELIEALLALANHGVTPCIPAKGSVGASGDLAPLAHMSCTLIGVGDVLVDGRRVPAAQGLEHAGLRPFTLGPKEGLALLNGTQVSTALALAGLFAAEDTFAAGLVAGALSLEAIKGSVKPFDARIHVARGQAGQIAVAGAVRAMLDGSDIVDSHKTCGRVQDPYSIRCQPQVMGACLDNLAHAARILRIEANAASDNPLVFSEQGDVVSGGIGIGQPAPQPASGVTAAITADKLDLDGWRMVLDTGSGERKPADTVDRSSPFLPERVGVRARTLDAFGRSLDDVSIDAAREAAGWNLQMASRQITGNGQWRRDSSNPTGALTVRLSHLDIPEATDDGHAAE
ncbi:UNVERIFIED_CONTAM: aromatic amino acid lyase, partial [Microbacterium sp. SLM126]